MQCILFNKKNQKKYRLNNFVALGSIQHTTGNWPLKGPALDSGDKYTTCLTLAWPIKTVFHLQFFRTKRLFAEFSLVSDIFRRKKSRISSYFLLFLNGKSRFVRKKFTSGKPALRSVCHQEFCKFYPNIHRIPNLTLKLWNDTERTFKCKWSDRFALIPTSLFSR